MIYIGPGPPRPGSPGPSEDKERQRTCGESRPQCQGSLEHSGPQNGKVIPTDPTSQNFLMKKYFKEKT